MTDDLTSTTPSSSDAEDSGRSRVEQFKALRTEEYKSLRQEILQRSAEQARLVYTTSITSTIILIGLIFRSDGAVKINDDILFSHDNNLLSVQTISLSLFVTSFLSLFCRRSVINYSNIYRIGTYIALIHEDLLINKKSDRYYTDQIWWTGASRGAQDISIPKFLGCGLKSTSTICRRIEAWRRSPSRPRRRWGRHARSEGTVFIILAFASLAFGMIGPIGGLEGSLSEKIFLFWNGLLAPDFTERDSIFMKMGFLNIIVFVFVIRSALTLRSEANRLRRFRAGLLAYCRINGRSVPRRRGGLSVSSASRASSAG